MMSSEFISTMAVFARAEPYTNMGATSRTQRRIVYPA